MECEKCKSVLSFSDENFWFCEKCDFWTADKNLEVVRSMYDKEYYDVAMISGFDHMIKEWTTNTEIIKKFVKQPGRHLEVGFREGAGIAAFSRMGFDSYGFDISLDSYRVAVSNGIDQRKLIIGNDLSEVKFDEKFDLITIREVIEHVPDPIKVLQQCVNLMKPSSVIQIQTPQYSTKIRNWTEKTHLRVYSLRSLSKDINDCGLKIVDTLTWEGGMCITCVLKSRLKIGLDLDGTIYSYPEFFGPFIEAMSKEGHQFYSISSHSKDEWFKEDIDRLKSIGINPDLISPELMYSHRHGDISKKGTQADQLDIVFDDDGRIQAHTSTPVFCPPVIKTKNYAYQRFI